MMPIDIAPGPVPGQAVLPIRDLNRKENALSSNAPSPPDARKPRSQAMRSEETVQALCAATIELMLDKGYHRLTTPMVAETAGMSRGALTHHFASREDLIVTAIDRHLRGVNLKLHDFAQSLGESESDVAEIVDYLWEIMSDGLFYMTMEYLPEARHNAVFRARLIPVVQEFHGGLDAIWQAYAAHTRHDGGRTAMLFNMTMCLIRGMIAQTILRDDPGYYRAMLAEWKSVLPGLLDRPARKADPDTDQPETRP